MTKPLQQLRIKIYADGADQAGILSLNANPVIQGMTTNPTLMRKAGIKDYEGFAREVLQSVRAKPISFEVFSDEFGEMKRQALKIASWQKNVYVKIPITNTRGTSARARSVYSGAAIAITQSAFSYRYFNSASTYR